MSFENNKLFMEAIKNNDIFSIKSDLEGFIPEFKGNKNLCDEVVEFAIKNSSFDWEEDDGISINTSSMNIKDRYNYEKGRLVQNFTKQRYLKVLDLYNQYHNINVSKTFNSKLDDVQPKIKLKESKIKNITTFQNNKSFKKKTNPSLEPEYKKIVIVVIPIILVLFLIVKILF